MRSLLYFFGCLTVIGFTLFLGHKLLFGSVGLTAPVAATAPPISVLSLTRKFRQGDIVFEKDILWTNALSTEDRAAYITRQEYEDRNQPYFSLAQDIQPGVWVAKSHVTWPSEPAFLSKTLRSGSRAVAVPFVNGNALVSAIWPGSRLDVVFTGANGKDNRSQGSQEPVVIAANVRVLANKFKTKGTEIADSRNSSTKFPILIMEVSIEQAKTLTLAKNWGILSPVLRSVAAANWPSLLGQQSVTVDASSLSLGFANGGGDRRDVQSLPVQDQTVFIQRGSKISTVSRGIH